jgi:hypothetical protein
LRRASLAAVLVLLVTSACGGNGDDSGAPDAGAVSITSPEDGATVSSTFPVAMSAESFTVEPAGDVREGAGHFHLMVDADCVAAGDQIPADDVHIHLADGSSETELTLPAGEHTLCLQAGDGQHVALPLTDTVTIKIASSSAETTTNPLFADATEVWSGSYEGEVVWDCGPAGTHRGTLEADFSVGVWRTEKAILVAIHTVTGSCQDTGRRTTTLHIDGTKKADVFTFPSKTWGRPGSVRFTVNGNRAEGQLIGAIPGPATIRLDFELTCTIGC